MKRTWFVFTNWKKCHHREALYRGLLFSLSGYVPINVFADYSGRHFNSSSADFLLTFAFIAIVVIAIILFVSGSSRKKTQINETVTPKQNNSYIPKVDVKKSTIAIISVSALEKKAEYGSLIKSQLSKFASLSDTERNDIQRIINKGACDAAREYKDRFDLIHYKEKRSYYSPPIQYWEYYDLAYETVISDSIKQNQIRHDIETGLIQCE